MQRTSIRHHGETISGYPVHYEIFLEEGIFYNAYYLDLTIYFGKDDATSYKNELPDDLYQNGPSCKVLGDKFDAYWGTFGLTKERTRFRTVSVSYSKTENGLQQAFKDANEALGDIRYQANGSREEELVLEDTEPLVTANEQESLKSQDQEKIFLEYTGFELGGVIDLQKVFIEAEKANLKEVTITVRNYTRRFVLSSIVEAYDTAVGQRLSRIHAAMWNSVNCKEGGWFAAAPAELNKTAINQGKPRWTPLAADEPTLEKMLAVIDDAKVPVPVIVIVRARR